MDKEHQTIYDEITNFPHGNAAGNRAKGEPLTPTRESPAIEQPAAFSPNPEPFPSILESAEQERRMERNQASI
jgi:hypothetical protein